MDGVCGLQTWETLVEAGFRVGDRFLYRRTPMLRGDDVADLQQRLCTLGFDTGRVDGIFGDDTGRALGEFQRNAGLPVDGIVGDATLSELLRLESRHHDPELVSAVRARAVLRSAPPTLQGRHIAVGETGGLGSVTGALRRRLTFAGIRVTELHHPDDAMQAREANELAVDVFVGLRLNPSTSSCRTAFWAGTHDESPGGRRLAEMVQSAVPEALGIEDGGVLGMSVRILRETTNARRRGRARSGQQRSSSEPRPWRLPSRRRLGVGPTSPGTECLRSQLCRWRLTARATVTRSKPPGGEPRDNPQRHAQVVDEAVPTLDSWVNYATPPSPTMAR